MNFFDLVLTLYKLRAQSWLLVPSPNNIQGNISSFKLFVGQYSHRREKNKSSFQTHSCHIGDFGFYSILVIGQTQQTGKGSVVKGSTNTVACATFAIISEVLLEDFRVRSCLAEMDLGNSYHFLQV